MPEPLRLRAALGRYPHTEPLRRGAVTPVGVRLEMVEVSPIIAAFRAMVRDLAYDVCELAPTTYLAAREAGVPIVALPVFLMRRFHHDDVRCRGGSGIAVPADLAGRRVGVRAYSVTTGVWVRGLLAREHAVDHRAIDWVVDDDEHVASLRLPPNVHRLESGDSLAAAFADGRIDAAFGGRAGIGRTGAPRAGWHAAAPAAESYRLFPDAEARDRRSFAATGIYPLHGLVCVRAALLEQHPWLAGSLTAAFTRAKQALSDVLPAGHVTEDVFAADAAHYRGMQEIVGADPLPYGLEANRTTVAALADFAYDQGVVAERPEAADLFAPIS
ncbi:MAG: hypothetical protein QM638_20595 [Nocardioides sp.]|uniref:hypothetical protein n=1 Tax=Nocardioides sp. TaxID=35761 RepID=UPI0039E68D13